MLPGLLLLLNAATAQDDPRRTPVVEALERAAPSVVAIECGVRVQSPFMLLGSYQSSSQGSGVIIHESGLALSNWHVVDAAMRRDGSQADDHQVKVSLPDGREFQVQVLSTSVKEPIDNLGVWLMRR